ncbi:MAG: ankyrin repeat domain-containing protein [Verrucomicrobiales bacterium]|nr:ankyrin repeat domain-containing protein [Verrucomicrobiales bacterium]
MNLFRTSFAVAAAISFTVLFTSCSDPQTSAIKTLKKNQYEFTADDFLVAAASEDFQAMQLFLDGGMEIDAIDAGGNTALLQAATNGRRMAAEMLLKAGADPRHTNSLGRTALIGAAEKGHTDVVRLLLGRGADPMSKDLEGWNALSAAAFNGQANTVELLAGHADQEMLDDSLLVACFKGEPAVIDHLLNQGAYINTRSPDNQTPLMIAALHGHEDAVRLLLQNQANPYALDSSEATAANLAEANGHEGVRDLILDPSAWGSSESGDALEAELAEALDALSGGNVEEVLGDEPEDADLGTDGTAKPMAGLNGATIRTENDREEAVASAFKLAGYREQPLPVMLKGVEGDSAQVRLLSSEDGIPVAVREGELIPGTHYQVTGVETKFISSKQGKGEMVDVSRITVENTNTGARHLLVKDVAGHSSETYAILTSPDSSYRYVVRAGDVFRTVDPTTGERDYQVLDIRPTGVVIKDLVTEEVSTIARDGMALN